MGTDHAPIIEALAGRARRGQPVPKVIHCPHENTAAHMAGGYAMATGRGQGVLVHVDVGTANTSNAMHNLYRSRIPVLLMAGKAPFTAHGELTGSRDNYVHFVQEPFDQGSPGAALHEMGMDAAFGRSREGGAAARPHRHAERAEGPGLSDAAARNSDRSLVRSGHAVVSWRALRQHAIGGADPQLVERLADAVLAAKNPMLMTSYGGRTPGTSDAIERLAEFAGMRVFESNMINNISHEGPCFSGFAPGPHVAQADFGLLVDVDVPWFPRDSKANDQTFWAQIDIDVIKGGSPMWSFPSHLRLQGNSARILAQLFEVLERKASPEFRKAAAERVKKFAGERESRLQKSAELAANPGKPGAINSHYLCRELGKRIDPKDFVFGEATRNTPAVLQQIPRPLQNTLMRVGGGGLGSSGGMALGAKLACPDRLAIQIIGDGSFYFNVTELGSGGVQEIQPAAFDHRSR